MMKDPYFYLAFMFIFNAIALPLHLIFVGESIMEKIVRVILSGLFMIWQAYIYLNR